MDFVLREVGPESGVVLRNLCGSHTTKRWIIEQMGSGAAMLDYDLDGDLDLYIANGADVAILEREGTPVRDALYRNEGGWRFVEVTEQAGLGDPNWSYGVAVGDVDGDGDPDLYVTNYGPNVLYENLGDGRFRDVTERAGVGDPGFGVSAGFADFDDDGDLDLYVANYLEFDFERPPNDGRPCDYKGIAVACGPVGLPRQADRLYRNEGDGRFADVSLESGVHAPEPGYGLGVVFGDYDDDGWVDLFVANDSHPNFLVHNLGGGKFEEAAWLAGVATQAEGRTQAGMGVDFGDADGDGRPDIFLSTFSHDHNTLFVNQGEGFFRDLSHPSGLGGPSLLQMGWGTRFFDLDNDGDQDLYVANGHIYPEVDAAGSESFRQADQLFLNDGRGRFVEASERIVRDGGPEVGRGAAFGDLDEDGDVDLVVVNMGAPPTLLRNEGRELGTSLVLDLRGSRGNTEGAGARLWVTAGGKTQRREATRTGSYASASDARVHFGLGGAARVDKLEVRWPGGGSQALVDLPAGRRLVLYQP